MYTQVTEHIGSVGSWDRTPSPGRRLRAAVASDISHGICSNSFPSDIEQFSKVPAKRISFPPIVMVISLAALAAGDSLLIWLYTSSVVAPLQAASVKP